LLRGVEDAGFVIRDDHGCPGGDHRWDTSSEPIIASAQELGRILDTVRPLGARGTVLVIADVRGDERNGWQGGGIERAVRQDV
jgi:hypothetical protein